MNDAHSQTPAPRAEPLPEELEGVGITEYPNAQINLDLEFVDEDGTKVKLGDYFKPGKPVFLTLNYYRCPMLCSLQLNGLIEALGNLSWTPGDKFEMVTVSFDPTEGPNLAKLKKQNYIKEFGRPEAAAGWHFLTGKNSAIKPLADSVGFGYKWNDERNEYMHAAAIFVCTPDGRVSRYLYGVMYDPKTIRLSLVEASKGGIGSPLDQILLYCYQYDPDSRSYAPVALNIMRLGGGATLVVLGITLSALFLRGASRRRTQLQGDHHDDGDR